MPVPVDETLPVPEHAPDHPPARRPFPGGLDTVVVPAEESGRPPSRDVADAARWDESLGAFRAVSTFAATPEGKALYVAVNREIALIGDRLDAAVRARIRHVQS